MSKMNKILKFLFPGHVIFKELKGEDKDFLLAIEDILTNDESIFKPNQALRDIEFVIFDTETTGFHAYGKDQVISIGAVKMKNGQVKENFYQLINPKRDIPPEIEKLTGITSEAVANQPSILEGIYKFLKFADHHFLVAHHADFDMHFLNLPLQRLANLQIPYPVIDTMMLAYHLNPSTRSQDLDSLALKYKIEIQDRHHALGDAMMTAELLDKFIQQLEEERGIRTIGGLKNSMPSICRQDKPYILFKRR